MAYHLSREARAGLAEYKLPSVFATELLDFQQAAVKIAAHHLHNRQGVMIGDVVGLGKTITATAVAKIMEDDLFYNTLIVCPLNLVPMWDGYVYKYQLHAKVVSHSMITRELPNLRRYKLVIIDESHNSLNVYYHNAPRYWIRATNFVPYFCNDKNGESLSTQIKVLSSAIKLESVFFLGLLNSSLYYLWFVALSDSRHLNVREISSFPHPKDYIDTKEYHDCLRRLMADYKVNRHRKSTYYTSTGNVEYDEYYPKLSKPIIDEIDTILAEHYGFTEDELDYIINYDIKYRMGIGSGSDDDDE
jgi:hypothetical protein